MTEKEAAALVAAHRDRYIRNLNIADWRINVAYGSCDRNCTGQCEVLSEYKIARIKLDATMHKNPQELLETFFHELIHVAVGEFELIRDLMLAHLQTKTEIEVFEKMYLNALERVVRQLETTFSEGFGYKLQVSA